MYRSHGSPCCKSGHKTKKRGCIACQNTDLHIKDSQINISHKKSKNKIIDDNIDMNEVKSQDAHRHHDHICCNSECKKFNNNHNSEICALREELQCVKDQVKVLTIQVKNVNNVMKYITFTNGTITIGNPLDKCGLKIYGPIIDVP